MTAAHRAVSLKLSDEVASAAAAVGSAGRDVKTMTGLLAGAQEKLRAASQRGKGLEADVSALMTGGQPGSVRDRFLVL